MSDSVSDKANYCLVSFNKSGIQGEALRKALTSANIHDVDVWTTDLQETDMPHTSKFHIVGEYRLVKRDLHKRYGKSPIIHISNPPCTYNTFVCPANHYHFGQMTKSQKERLALKTKWMKIMYDILMDPLDVIMMENPRGYVDNVIKRTDNKDSYVSIQPWNFGNEKEDLHTKETHIWSGGKMSAIEKISLLDYVTVHEKPKNVQHNWVLSQKDSNARSKFSPGLAKAVAECAVERMLYIRSEEPTKPTKFVFDDRQIQPCLQPANMCGKLIVVNGKRKFCNLRIGHDSAKNMGKGCSFCGLMDYDKGGMVFQQTHIQSKRVCRRSSL
jgi:hypothetical protein